MSQPQDIDIYGQTFKIVVSDQHAWFWQQVKDGGFEPETFALYKSVITPETLYIDIGSWIGPTVLFGGSLAKRAVAVEPIAVSMAAMLKNLELNPEVFQKTDLFNLAIAPTSQVIRLYNNDFGDGMASILPTRGGLSMTFMAMGIEDFLDRVLGDETHVFIKVDIEGGEFDLVPTMCDSLRRRGLKADLYISFHGSFTKDASARMDAWASNLTKHGVLFNALATYGDVRFWFGDRFIPIDGAFNTYLPFTQLLIDGGVDTTVFVQAK